MQKGYDFCVGATSQATTRLWSATTGGENPELEEFHLFGLGQMNPPHQHILFRRCENELMWGENVLTPGSGEPTMRQSLSTEYPPLVAKIEVEYDHQGGYAVNLQETLPGSTQSSDYWTPRDYTKREIRNLPGGFGESGMYEVRLLVGDWSTRSSDLSTDATIAPFAPESSAALLIEWTPSD